MLDRQRTYLKNKALFLKFLRLSTKNSQEQTEDEAIVRILFQGVCPKLTPSGVGNVEYKIGINDETDEAFLRFARNESSGAFSTYWIGINEIRTILGGVRDQSFRAIILRDLYMQKSSNNYGFLTAILKAEGVVVNLPDQLTVMRLENWEPLLKKIGSLKKTDVSLTDPIAIAAKKRTEEKVERMAKVQAEKVKETKKSANKGSSMSGT